MIAKISGKMTALVIFVLLLLFVGFVLTPLIMAPFGVFSGLARGLRDFTANSYTWHVRPWFPFVPLWSFSFLLVFIWIAVIVWVYKDAERRGMNGLLWALLVFFGNLIGLLIFLLVRQDEIHSARARTTAPAPPPKSTISCASCQKPVEKDFTYCPHCGAPLQQNCRNCGKPLEPAWKVCPQCGASLKAE